LQGFASNKINRRFSVTDRSLVYALVEGLIKKTVETTTSGKTEWQPEANPNILDWLLAKVLEEIDKILPSDVCRPAVKVAETQPKESRRRRSRTRGRGRGTRQATLATVPLMLGVGVG
jgi:hypothetical protein